MRFSYFIFIVFCVFGIYLIYSFFTPVNLGENNLVIELPYGTSITKSSQILEDSGVIRSNEAYLILSKIIHPTGVVAGRYSFSGKVSIFSVLYNTSHGLFGREQTKLTIPEGFTVNQIIKRIENLFPNIDKQILAQNLNSKEGYIFPETYFFDKDVTAEYLTNYLITESDKKLQKILGTKDTTTTAVKNKIIIASLLESEGRTKEERHMIAGIINNRIVKDMPLQLDATITYLTGRDSSEITLKDLKINSPYNTYLYKGLPEGPISNPGEESLFAAMNPTTNSFLYYLHAPDGEIYYAKTYTEHLKNKNKYLK